MRFEAKKKALTSAISDVRSITETLELAEGSTTALRLKTDGKIIKVSSLYAEATVSEVVVEEAGDIVVDVASLLQALSVSGNEFKLTTKGKNVNYACGRVNGSITLQAVDLDESILLNAPKPTIHVLNLKELLSSLALKAQGRATDRTLHFDAKGKKIRGESTDSFRGVVVTIGVDKDSKIPSNAALSLPQKSADVLAKLAADSMVGFNESFFTVKLPGFITTIPLSAVEPLQIQNQLADLLGSQKPFGEAVFNVSELKDALSDAISAVGKANSPALALVLNKGNTDCLFTGEASSGEAQIAFKAESVSLNVKSVSLGLTALYLQECLNFYSADKVKCTVYQQAVVLDLTDTTEFLLGQTTLVPLISLVEDQTAPKADDEGEEEKAPPPKAKAKPASKAAAAAEEDEKPAAPKKEKLASAQPTEEDSETEDEDFDDEE